MPIGRLLCHGLNFLQVDMKLWNKFHDVDSVPGGIKIS